MLVNISVLLAADVHSEAFQSAGVEEATSNRSGNIVQSIVLIDIDKVDKAMEMRVSIVLVLNCTSKSISTAAVTTHWEHAASEHVLARLGLHDGALAVVIADWAEGASSATKNPRKDQQRHNTEGFDSAESISCLPPLARLILGHIDTDSGMITLTAHRAQKTIDEESNR